MWPFATTGGDIEPLRVLHERLLFSGILLAALAMVLLGVAVRLEVPAGGERRSITGLFGGVAGSTPGHMALLLCAMAGSGWVLMAGHTIDVRLADAVLVGGYAASVVATWWLCLDSSELLWLAAPAVAAVGVLLFS